jgi:hypothetical protein
MSFNELNKEIFQNYLKDIFDQHFERLNETLIRTGAVIAGGSLTSIYTGKNTVNDLDFYVNRNQALELKDFLMSTGYTFSPTKNYIAPAYDNSFFKKNNIVARFMFIKEGLVRIGQYEEKYPSIDVMIIKDSESVVDVVTNFDLSFCEIFYDGREVKTPANPNDIFEKKGILKPLYVNSLYELNNFTIRRIQKYMVRGFSISYKCDRDEVLIIKKPKGVNNEEEWVINLLYKTILFNNTVLSTRARSDINIDARFRYVNPINAAFKIICLYPLEVETKEDFDRLAREKFYETDLKQFYIKIICSTNYNYFPSKYKNYIKNVLDVTRQEIYDNCEFENDVRDDYIYLPPRRSGLEDDDDDDYMNLSPRRSLLDDDDLDDDDDDYMNLSPRRSPEIANIEDEEEYEFEEIDIDENTININTCNDLFMLDENEINIYLQENDTFLLVNKSPDNSFDALCFEKEYINQILNNKNDNWFYECNGSFIDDTNDRSMNSFINFPYLKIPISSEGLNAFIPVTQIKALLNQDNKIYYIVPKLEDGVQKMITHTVSWQNSYGPPQYRNFVSANHCQSGSSILVYDLQICKNPSKCVKSFKEY